MIEQDAAPQRIMVFGQMPLRCRRFIYASIKEYMYSAMARAAM
jgi:hypothetical protein